MTASTTAGRQRETDDTKYVFWDLRTICDSITRIAMLIFGACATCLSIFIWAPGVSQRPGFSDLNVAEIATFEGHESLSY